MSNATFSLASRTVISLTNFCCSSTASDALRRALIDRAVDDLTDELVAVRRDLHAHPEVGNAEHRTTALVVERLERAGLVAKVLPVGTGAWCDVLPAGFDYASAVRRGQRLRIATKYVQVATRHFARKGVHTDVIKLYGSMELAPLVGLADAIVDVVSTGGTLKANNLVEVEEIMPISARLIVNQAALKMRQAAIAPLIAALERAAARGAVAP